MTDYVSGERIPAAIFSTEGISLADKVHEGEGGGREIVFSPNRRPKAVISAGIPDKDAGQLANVAVV